MFTTGKSMDKPSIEKVPSNQGDVVVTDYDRKLQSSPEDGRAQTALEKEHRMPLKLAVRAYWPAIIWSVLLSSAVIMEGILRKRSSKTVDTQS